MRIKAWIIVPVQVTVGSEEQVQQLADELGQHDPPCNVISGTPAIHWERTQ